MRFADGGGSATAVRRVGAAANCRYRHAISIIIEYTENDACDPSGPHAHKCFGLEKKGVVYYKVQYSFTSSAVMRSPLRIMRRSTTLRSSRILPLHGIAERASNASRSTSLRCMPCSSAILSTK